MVETAIVLGKVVWGLNLFLTFAVLALAVAALVLVALTREDAFTVIDREKKNWLMLTGGAAALALLSAFVPTASMFWVIACVIVGIYWQDVRPAIKDVLDNTGGSW